MGEIKLQKGDLCTQRADAIVNAANTDLLHGGGVAYAIVAAGGKKIQEESGAIAPIPLGEAAVTTAGRLKAKIVIHAASMLLGGETTAESLTQSLRNSFLRAAELGLKTIALPAIGAGIGGFSIHRCAEISLTEAKKFLEGNAQFGKVTFVLHSDSDFQIFSAAYNKIINSNR